jgi:hypothetical protein
MRVLISAALVALLSAGVSYGDNPPPSLPPTAAAEAVTAEPATSALDAAPAPRDPFSLYDVGPLGTKVWSYKQLTPAEQAQVVRGVNAGPRAQTTGAYVDAVRETSRRAAATAAAQQLGVENLPLIGVVQ